MWVGLNHMPSNNLYIIYTTDYENKKIRVPLRAFLYCYNDLCFAGDHLLKVNKLMNLLVSKYKMHDLQFDQYVLMNL
jgi:hypothetical protein